MNAVANFLMCIISIQYALVEYSICLMMLECILQESTVELQ